MFFDVTDSSSKLSNCFQSEENFKVQSKYFFKTLNQTFQQCFRKVRITNKSHNLNTNDEVQMYMDLKTKLCVFSKEVKSKSGRHIIENKIDELEKKIMNITSSKNANTIN